MFRNKFYFSFERNKTNNKVKTNIFIFVQNHCTLVVLLCQMFFESLLHDIDLCQLEALPRRFQIGWCPGAIRDECFLVIVSITMDYTGG